MMKAYKPIIEGKYKVNRDTRSIIIIEHKEDSIQRVCNTSISTEAVELDTLNEEVIRPIRNLCIMSSVSEINNFLSRMSWIPIKRSMVKDKYRIPVLMKWLFKSKE